MKIKAICGGKIMTKKTRLISSFFLILVFISIFSIATAKGATWQCLLKLDSKIAMINNELYELDTIPKVIEGHTMLPFRFVAENILNARVSWDATSKTVAFEKDGKKVILNIGSKIAEVNGDVIFLDVAPLIENGRTLVPLRFLGENFDLFVDYMEEGRMIILTKEVDVEPPVARFRFSESELTAGQTLKVIDESDAGEYSIIDREWEIILSDGKTITTKDITSVLRKPSPGTYIVRLRVKNELNVWSDWLEKELVVKENKPPVIVDLTPSKKSVAQGEEIDFSIEVENEEWEEIVEEKWSYRYWTDPEREELSGLGKPRAFFYPGEYEVKLEVLDEYGNWSNPKTTIINVTKKQKQSEYGFKFSEPKPGEVIDNPHKINFNDYDIYEKVKTEKTGPTLMFSNSPENVTQTGILYQDVVTGPVRVMFHHKNGIENLSKKYRLLVIAENIGTDTATIIKTKEAVGGPSEDVMHIGQVVAMRYFKSDISKKLTLAPGDKAYLYDSLPSNWKFNQTITAMLDFETKGFLKVTIVAVEKDFNLDDYDSLPVLARDDIHFRGTFPTADTIVEVDFDGSDTAKIVLGKDKEGFEEWLEGYDALTGDAVINKGNYGAVYKFTFKADKKTGILLNPRGLTFKGAFQGFDSKVYKAPGVGGFYGSNKASVVGVLEKGDIANFLYTPPNGSDAPVLLIMIPKKNW